ncbi:MAG: HD domain-containing protein [Candidatus Nealsonbacteria bacterium]|nr:HD domain-containing protein [Candidatus Nealsonbacteria bacterium]
MPELEEGYKVGQNKHHIYDCWEHSLKSLDYAVKKNFNKHVRIAALMHDIAKPRVKAGRGSDSTFYNHEIVGARMTKDILERLKFSKKDSEKIVRLVRYHLFYYNVGEVKEASVRRLVKNAGIENMEELLEVRQSDRIGSGVPKAEPYKLRHLKYLIEKVSQDPISAKALEINGNDIIKLLNIKPGKKIGWILEILLADILGNPKGNKKELLFERAKELGRLSDKELSEKSKKAQSEISQVETKKDKMTKDKYWVV